MDDIAPTDNFDPKLVELNYYHGWLPREDVRYLLQRNGDFLVRITEADGKLDMILCVLNDEEGRYQDKKGPVEEEDVFNLIIHGARNKYYIGNFLLFKSVDELTNYYSKHSLAIDDLKLKLRRPVALASWELRADELQLGQTIDKSGCIEIRKGLFKREDRNWETAVTSVRGRSAAAKATIQEMMRQCRLLREFHHPCVIEYYGVCLVTHPCYFLLEYVPGGPLDDYLRSKEGKMKKEEMLRMIVSAGWGLEFLHSNYIIHRDISAKNCFYDTQMVKLSGFGLARKTLNYTMKTMKKLVVNWMAPETLKDFRYSQKSDVYSFGVLAFEIFSQREPYEGVPSQEVKALILEGKLNDFPPETPKKLADYVLDKLWDSNPSKRPSMTEIMQWLGRYTGLKLQKAVPGVHDTPYDSQGRVTKEPINTNYIDVSRASIRQDPNAPAFKDVTHGGEHDLCGVSTQSTAVTSQTQRTDTRSVDTRRRPQSALSQPRTLPGGVGGQPQPASEAENLMDYENLAAVSMQHPSRLRTYHPSQTRTPTQARMPTQARTPTRTVTPTRLMSTSPVFAAGGKPYTSLKTGRTPSNLSFQPQSVKPATLPTQGPAQTLKLQMPEMQEQPGQMEYENLAAISQQQLNQQLPAAGTKQYIPLSAQQRTGAFTQPIPGSPAMPTQRFTAKMGTQQLQLQQENIPVEQMGVQQVDQQVPFDNNLIPGMDVSPMAAQTLQQQLVSQKTAAQRSRTRAVSAQQPQQMPYRTAQQMGQVSFKTAAGAGQGGMSMKPMSVQQMQGIPGAGVAQGGMSMKPISVQQMQGIPGAGAAQGGMSMKPMSVQQMQGIPGAGAAQGGMSMKPMSVQQMQGIPGAGVAQGGMSMKPMSIQQMQGIPGAGVAQGGMSMKPMSVQQMQGFPGVPEQAVPGQQVVADQQFPPLPDQGVPAFDMGAQPVQPISFKTAAGLSRKSAAAPLTAQQIQQMSYKPGGVSMKPMSAQQQLQQVSMKPATMPFVPGTPTKPSTQPQQQFPTAAPVSAQRSAAPPVPGRSFQMQQQFPPSPGAFSQGFSPSKMF